MILESLQVAIFLKKLSAIGAREVWDALGLDSPELVQESPAKKSSSVSGSDGMFSYQVTTSPLRIDVVIAPLPPTEPTDGVFGITNIGDAFERASRFKTLFTSDLIERIGYPSRLAVVVSFVERFESSTEANRKLISDSGLTHKEAESSVDLIFRINHREHSKTMPSLEINNLATWQVLHAQSTIVIVPLSGTTIAPTQNGRSSWLLRSNLDINTVADNRIEDDSNLVEGIFNELIEGARTFWVSHKDG